MISIGLEKLKHSKPLSLLKGEDGYLLIVVTLIGLILGILFGVILPQLHSGQQTRAVNNLNEYRALEAARTGINAVRSGLKDLNNLLDLTGYPVSGATPGNTFAINGNYAALFPSGVSLQVYYSFGNDGEYAVTGATNFNSAAGVTTEITVDQTFPDNTADGVLCRDRGIFRAIDRLCGATTVTTNHHEYRDEDGNVQFVSGCKGIDLDGATGNEDGKIDVFVILNPVGDDWLFHDTNSGVSWVSVGRWPWATPDVGYFRYADGDVYYYDFDMKATLDGTNYMTNADLKCRRTPEGRWLLSIGNDGSFRGKDPAGTTELWTLEKDFASGTTPFQGKDNNADGNVNDDDKVEVFVIVRSSGITAAPGTDYATDKRSLKLVRDANANLPNPMRQVLEGALYVEEEP